MKAIGYLALAMTLAASCSGPLSEEMPAGKSGTESGIALHLHTLPFEGEQTKSRFDECQCTVSGINILVYEQSGGDLVGESSGYFTIEELRGLKLPATGIYNVYFLANVPDLTDSFPENESGIGNWGCRLDSYDDFLTNGFPMSYSQSVDAGNEEVINVWFRRLVTRLELSFDKSALSAVHQRGTRLKSLRIFNAALDIFPFMEGGSRSTVSTGDEELADKAPEADVNILNEGGSVFLYTLTNMQGTLLPADTPQSGKTPEALQEIVSEDRMRLLTYIEARCELDCDDWNGDDVVLRHYLGGDCTENYNSSFDIQPGKSRRIDLVLTEDDPMLQPWRFDSEGTVGYKKFELERSEVHVMKNFPCEFTVSAPFDFEIRSTGENFSASVTESVFDEENGKWDKTVRVETSRELSSLLEHGQEPSPISEQLVLGALTRSGRDTCVTVRIYDVVFPLTLCLDSEDSLRILGENPLGMNFRCDFEVMDRNGTSLQYVSYSMCTPSAQGKPQTGYGNAVGKVGYDGDGPIVLSVLIQPHWNGNSGFFMGSGNAALFGPGTRFSPGRLDATKKIMYCPPRHFLEPYTLDFFSNVEYRLTLSYTNAGSSEAPKLFFLPSTDEGDAALVTTDGFAFGKSDYRFNIGTFTPDGSTGHNNADNYTLEDFGACPFYITNGCMQCTQLYLRAYSWNTSNKLEEVTLKFLSPGRDLCAEEGKYGQNSSEAELLFRIRGSGSASNLQVRVDEASYEYSGVHLIVNGCTCWPGGSSQ